MKSTFLIDMWNGEVYDKAKHFTPVAYWSDDAFYYWGWIYNANGKEIGDWRCGNLTEAENALGVNFVTKG